MNARAPATAPPGAAEPQPAPPERPLPPVPKTDAELIAGFNRLYYKGLSGRMPPFATHYWRGVRMLKCPMDVLIYQELVHYVRPDVIVETGVFHGGTTLFLADLCEVRGHGLVVGVDIDIATAAPIVREHPRTVLLQGSSVDPLIFENVRLLTEGKRVLVFLDSNHEEPHVAAELALYSTLVQPGGYLVVEDTNLPLVAPDAAPGPAAAVQKFLAKHPEWQPDLNSERGLVTFNPGGYLVRTG